MTKTVWQTWEPVVMDLESVDAKAKPEFATTVRCLWSEKYLYIAYRCPFTQLTTFNNPAKASERAHPEQAGESLWDRNVAEAFIGPDAQNVNHYFEF